MASKSNQVRIIGGQWGGRKLDFPSINGLRPTTDRIRETLFNWLQPHLSQSNCLDLYAGSGALGFEAASRGAKQVVMVESKAVVIESLKLNKRLLKADSIQIIQGEAQPFLKKGSKQSKMLFDVVFLDPPFKQEELMVCVKQLEESNCLSDNAVIYLECKRKLTLNFLPPNWTDHRSKTAGQVAYYLYHRESA